MPCVTILILIACLSSTAQVLQTDRIEIPIFNEEKFEIIPGDSSGLYLYRMTEMGRQDQLQLIRLDTTFQEKWGGFLPIPNNHILIGRKAQGENLYILLRYKDYSRNNLTLFVIHNKFGQYSEYEIKSYIPFAPTDFQVTEQAIILGGYYNRVPVVLHFSFATLKSKVLPGLFNEAGELTQIKTYPDGTFDVLISAVNIKRQRTISIKNYDAEGAILSQFSLDPADKHLIFGRSIKGQDQMQLVAGVYGTSRGAEFSRGIFMSSIDPSGMEQTRYYNFADLDNFFKYMKGKREQRVKARIERRKIKGKKIRFNYRFLVHELVFHRGQYILLGEAFYPRYINSDRSYGSFFTPFMSSNTRIVNGRIFDGYYYTHAVVMGFDEKGNLLWDNSFEINDVKTFTLEQFVKLEVLDDKIALLYLFDNKIRTKIIKDSEVVEGKTMDPIRTLHETDVVKKENVSESKLEYWYGDYMYAYGVRDVATNYGRGPRKRVFFINKVTYSN